MTTLAESKERLAEHASALRAYAERVFVRHAPLTSIEESDRARRMQEYFEIGGSFRLTESEMVVGLYRGLLGSADATAPRVRAAAPPGTGEPVFGGSQVKALGLRAP